MGQWQSLFYLTGKYHRLANQAVTAFGRGRHHQVSIPSGNDSISAIFSFKSTVLGLQKPTNQPKYLFMWVSRTFWKCLLIIHYCIGIFTHPMGDPHTLISLPFYEPSCLCSHRFTLLFCDHQQESPPLMNGLPYFHYAQVNVAKRLPKCSFCLWF